MALRMFNSLLPYFGNKRKLCPVIFKLISKYYARNNWFNMTFVDAFMASGAVSLFAKAQGFRVISNDIAERSYIAGKALIENNRTKIDVLFRPHPENQHKGELGDPFSVFIPHFTFIERHL
jgi:adenine-specific DNA methylase